MSKKYRSGTIASRRGLLKAAAGVAAGTALPAAASAQSGQGADPDLARLQSQRRILLKGGVVLSMDPQVGNFANADVLIEAGKIRDVRPGIAAADAATVDASNRIVIPGFTDTHSHSYQGILRNILSNGRVDPDYNRDIVGRITPAYTPQDAYIGMLATALGMIDMGTTGVIDVSQVNNTPEHSDALIKALQDAGIRAMFGYSAGVAGAGMQHPQDIARLKRTYFSSKDQLLTLALGIGPDPKMFQIARDNDVPVVAHLRNTLPQRDDGARLKALSHAGLLRPGDAFIHLLHMPPEPLQLIKDSGCHVSLSTAVEMTMGHGVPCDPERARRRPATKPQLGSCCDLVVRHVLDDADDRRGATLRRLCAREKQPAERAEAFDLPRDPRIRHHQRCALRQRRRQGRHLDAGQGCRPAHAQSRQYRYLAAQQRARRRGQPDGPSTCRGGIHRRPGEEVARQPGGRRHAARPAVNAGGA